MPVDPGVSIAHVHLKAADLERALKFYCGVLGFNGVELYWDRPESSWPRSPDGSLAMYTRPLDVPGLLREAP
jgi:catechol 2,3-dioxygenase